MVLPPFVISLVVAGASHGALSATPAAGGFPLFLVPDHDSDDSCYDQAKYSADYDCSYICSNPR